MIMLRMFLTLSCLLFSTCIQAQTYLYEENNILTGEKAPIWRIVRTVEDEEFSEGTSTVVLVVSPDGKLIQSQLLEKQGKKSSTLDPKGQPVVFRFLYTGI